MSNLDAIPQMIFRINTDKIVKHEESETTYAASSLLDMGGHEPALQQSEPCCISSLWRTRNSDLREVAIFRCVSRRYGQQASWLHAGQNRLERPLRTCELPLGSGVCSGFKSKNEREQQKRSPRSFLVCAHESMDGVYRLAWKAIQPWILRGLFRSLLREEIGRSRYMAWRQCRGIRSIGKRAFSGSAKCGVV